MKTKQGNRRMRVTLLLSTLVVLTNVIIFSCQKDGSSKKTGWKPTNPMNTEKNEDDCATQCIAIGGPYIEVSDKQTIDVNDNFKGKVVEIVYYNTETDFVIKVRSTAGWTNIFIDGKAQWTGEPVAPGRWETFSRPLDLDWKACDLINFDLKVVGIGSPALFHVRYNLIGICEGDCKPKFYGQTVSCAAEKEITYTYMPNEDYQNIKIEGDLLNFKGEDAFIEVNGAEMKITQWSDESSSNRHILLTGDVQACETVKIIIRWKSGSFSRTLTGPFRVSAEDGTELAPAVLGLVCPKN